MKTLDDMLTKQLEDEEFKKEYEAVQQELGNIKREVDNKKQDND